MNSIIKSWEGYQGVKIPYDRHTYWGIDTGEVNLKIESEYIHAKKRLLNKEWTYECTIHGKKL
jgi:hypothetical protein